MRSAFKATEILKDALALDWLLRRVVSFKLKVFVSVSDDTRCIQTAVSYVVNPRLLEMFEVIDYTLSLTIHSIQDSATRTALHHLLRPAQLRMLTRWRKDP